MINPTITKSLPEDEEGIRGEGSQANGPSSDSTTLSGPREGEELQEFTLIGGPLPTQCTRTVEPPLETSSAPFQPTSKLPSIPMPEANMYMTYCMTMLCLQQYGVSTTNESIFHSKDIPRISVRHYMERLLDHPFLSPSAMLAGLILIFRFSFARFPVDVYSVHRLILVGTTIGSKQQDDSVFSIPYVSELGGVNVDELITLQNTFCKDLNWNLFFYPEDYKGLLAVMEKLLQDPTADELDAFAAMHAKEIESFNPECLRVATGMRWFRGEYRFGSAEKGAALESHPAEVKAVYSLLRWEMFMTPWLNDLRARCEHREKQAYNYDGYGVASPREAPSSSPTLTSSDAVFPSQVASFPQFNFPSRSSAYFDPYTRSTRFNVKVGKQGVDSVQRPSHSSYGAINHQTKEHMPRSFNQRGGRQTSTVEMKNLTYASSYRPAIGQKRCKPKAFSDGYDA